MNVETISTTARFRSLDIVRGAVMVLMAIDHVRVYAGVPAGGPEPAIFFTRWITHFCAPVFVFLAGTSAFLYGYKTNNKRKLAIYLLSRGLLLVLLELTLIRFSWTFNLDYGNFLLAGVIWMIGWCMVLLSMLIWLRPLVVGIIGLSIIFLQQLFGLLPEVLPLTAREPFGRFWEFIYSVGLEGPQGISILYVLVPWIGVMAAGYSFGCIMLLSPERRRKICLWIGLSSILLFLAIGSILVLRQDPGAEAPPFILRLLNQRKYPASQLFLLMTLGPSIMLIPFAEKKRGWLSDRITDRITVFGKVPFFYYLLHIPIIHLSALIVNFLKAGAFHSDWYSTAPFAQVPEEGKWGLPLLYLVVVIDIIILYFFCKWYVGYKFSHPDKKWLKYI